MRIDLFKNQILNKTVTDNFIIFKGNEDSYFIMKQYYDEIAKFKNLEVYILDKLDYDSLKNNDYYLFIYKVKIFDDEKLSNMKNLIVICDDLSEDCTWMFASDIVEFPKITDWMIKDYIASNVDKLSDENILDLFEKCNKDIYKIDNEIFKLKLFNNYNPNLVYDEYKDTIDDNSTLALNIVNCIIDNNYLDIKKYLPRVTNDFNALGFIALLKNTFKKVIDIQLNPKANNESLGMTSKQFWYYKYNKCNKYTKLQLLNIYSLLTSIDYKLKMGYFQDINIFDYIIIKIYSIGYT